MATPFRPSAPAHSANSSAAAAAPSAKGGCGGDRCASGRDAWPLHHFRHEGVFCLLCSSCVLLYSPSAFCAACVHILATSPAAATARPGDPAVAAPGPTVLCSACGVSVAHLSCLPAPADDHPAPFVCPPCAAAAEGRPFSFAPAPGRRPLQERDARVLLVAARLSHDSVSRAAAAAREEAERRVAEAAEARKRSREMLDAAFRALEAEAREAKLKAAAPAQPPPPLPKKEPEVAPPAPLPKKKPEAAQPPPPLPKKQPEASRDKDKLLKLNPMQQPALAFAAAAAAAAAATSVPLPTPSYREEKKPVVKQEAQGSVPPQREDQDRPPLFGTLQS